MTPYRLVILTPDRTVFDGQVSSLVVQGAAGSLGVLAGHAPLATPLLPGRVEWADSDGRWTRGILRGTGFLEVAKAGVTLLTEGVNLAP